MEFEFKKFDDNEDEESDNSSDDDNEDWDYWIFFLLFYFFITKISLILWLKPDVLIVRFLGLKNFTLKCSEIALQFPTCSGMLKSIPDMRGITAVKFFNKKRFS